MYGSLVGEQVGRIGSDFTRYHEAKGNLTLPDGVHCIICGVAFDRPDGRKKYCSRECYDRWYTSLGVPDWNDTRRAVIERDGKCMDCCAERVPFEVHHLVRIADGGDEFDVDNCVTLCVECHKTRHNRTGNKIRNNTSLEGYI